MKQLYYCALSSLLLLSCSGGTTTVPEAPAQEITRSDVERSGVIEDEAVTAHETFSPPRIAWKELEPGAYDTPRTQVLLEIGDRLTVLDTVHNPCSEIPAGDYEAYGIPKDATMAAGGWFAGGGEYFYTIVKKGRPLVYRGWADEGQEDEGYHWKRLEFGN